MVNVDSIRRLLAIADTAKDPYAVAEVAGELLAAAASDAFAAAAYARALLALGLPEAAQRVLASQTPFTITPGNTGLVPWASRARRFSANLASLTYRNPAAASLIQTAATGLATLELHLSNDGNFQILDTTLPLHRGWLTGLGNHKAAENLWPTESGKGNLLQPILFESLGFGWLFLHGLQRTDTTFLQYRCPFYVLEPDPLALAIAMHVHDLREVFAASRVRFFVGAGPAETLAQFRAAVLDNKDWTLPGTVIRNPLRLPRMTEIDALLAELRDARRTREQTLRAAITDYYADKTPESWRQRFAEVRDDPTAEPLRVLGITSRYTTVLQHSMAELQKAVQSTGTAEMRIAIEPNDESLENPLLEMIANYQPDLIVQISRMRYEHAALPANVPFLCWDQDSLSCMRTPAATASLDPLTYVAGHGAVFGHTNLQWPRRNCIFCHPAGATFRYSNQPLADAQRSRFECDLSYVSNASGTPEDLAASLLHRWNDPVGIAMFKEAAAIIRTESEAGGTWDYVRILNLLKSMGSNSRLAPGQQEELTLNLSAYADRCFRHAALGWVSRWCLSQGKTLRLFGHGWNGHPEFSRWAAGPAQPGDEVRAIYQASCINLQIIEPGFIHSRALDGLAAGGFFLARRTAADGLDAPEVATLHELGQWIGANAIATDEELNAVEDPEIRAKVAKVRAYFHRHGVFAPLVPSLHVWADVPPACLIFPQLPAITFHDEPSFGELVTHFLENPDRRTALAAEMRQVVLERFSYTARWKTFLESIGDGLRAATAHACEMSV